MLDLSKDERCNSLVNQLDYCADKFCESADLKRKVKNDSDFRKSVICFDEAGYARDVFLQGLSDYIASFSNIDDKKQIAGSFLFRVLNAYNSEENKKIRKAFVSEGVYIASKIIEKHPLTDLDIKRYRAHITKSRKKKKLTPKALSVLYPEESLVGVEYKNPLENKNINVVVPTGELLKEYTSYLCQYAADKNDENVSVAGIYTLLQRNAEHKGMCDVSSTLFDEGYKKEAIDKKMVLEVAKVYAQNIDIDAITCGENNEKFDKNMCKMFANIVTKYGYKKKDVEELKNVLIENSSDKRYAQDLGATIDYAYNLPRQTSKGMKR